MRPGNRRVIHVNSSGICSSSRPAASRWGLFLPLMMVGILLFMYFTTIRPQRKRQKEHAAMVSALKKGDEVALSSGMLGKISGLDANYLVLSVGNNVELKFQKIHVTSVLPKGTLKSVGVDSIKYPPRLDLARTPTPLQFLSRASEKWVPVKDYG